MKYYYFHIKDYIAQTRHLTPLEDIAYRRMLDLYYTREGPLPIDVSEIAKLICMRDEAATVRDVLNEFFEQSRDGWRNKRCDEELASLYARSEQAREKANRRWKKPPDDAPAMPQHSPGNAEVVPEQCYPIPNTQDPIPNTQITTTDPPRKTLGRAVALPVCPAGVEDQVWLDFIAHRKRVKAPVTETALKGFAREAQKAGISLNDAISVAITQGWRGFKAEWVQSQNYRDQLHQHRMQQVAGLTGGRAGAIEPPGAKWVPAGQAVIDVEASDG